MYKFIQILTLVIACVTCIQPANAAMIISSGDTIYSSDSKSHERVHPLTSFFGGVGLIGIGLWMNHKNKV